MNLAPQFNCETHLLFLSYCKNFKVTCLFYLHIDFVPLHLNTFFLNFLATNTLTLAIFTWKKDNDATFVECST